MKRRNNLQMRKGLELNLAWKEGSQFMLQFATRSHFQAFDSLFGAYSQYGFAEPNPRTGETKDARETRFIFHMGSAAFPGHYQFKRQMTKMMHIGVDL